MGFDPKAFLDEPDTTPTAPAFDPQAFLADEPPPPEPAYQPKPGDIPINLPKQPEGVYGEDIARFEQQKAQNPDILKQKQDFMKPVMAGALNTAGFAAEMITKIPKWWKGFEDKGYDDQLKRLDEWEQKGANPEFIISQRERIQKERGNLQTIGDKAVKPVVKAVEPLTKAVKQKTLEWSETISPIADEAAALREELSDIGAGKDKFIDDMVDSYKKGTLDTKLNWFGTQALLRGDKKSAELSKQLAEEYRQAQLEDWQKQQQDPNFVGPVKPVSPGKFREITRSVARMAPGLVTSMAVSAVPIVGAPAAFAGWASQGAGQVYQDAVAQGADPEKARVSAAIAGPIYAAVEQIQIGQIAKNPVIKGKLLHFFKEYGIDVAKEVNEEGLQGVVTTIATEKAKGNEDVNDIAKKAWESYLENAKSSIASLAVVTGATRGAHVAVGAMAGKPPAEPSKPGVDITVGGQNAEGDGSSAQEASGQEGTQGQAEGGIHLQNNAGKNLLATGQEILKGISDEEQGAILRKVQGEKQAKEGMQNIVANMTTEEAQQIIAKAKLPNVDATKADADALARVKESADKILSEKKPTGEGSIYNMVQPAPADQEAGKTIAERHGLNFVDATEGLRDQGGVVLNFKDEISGKTISAPAGTAESEIAKTLADTRRLNPKEYGQNVAKKAGVEFIGNREELTKATGKGTYESEMRASFKTPLGNQITVPFSSTVEEIKTRAAEMDKQAGAPNVPEKVQAPTEVKPEIPVSAPVPQVNRDTDRMLKMYLKDGRTETSIARDTQKNLLNVLSQVIPQDVAESVGITEEQAAQGMKDLQENNNTEDAKKIRDIFAPPLFYGETVDEAVKSIKRAREVSGPTEDDLFGPARQPEPVKQPTPAATQFKVGDLVVPIGKNKMGNLSGRKIQAVNDKGEIQVSGHGNAFWQPNKFKVYSEEIKPLKEVGDYALKNNKEGFVVYNKKTGKEFMVTLDLPRAEAVLNRMGKGEEAPKQESVPMKETAITPTKAGLVATEKKADAPREQTVPPAQPEAAAQPEVAPVAIPEKQLTQKERRKKNFEEIQAKRAAAEGATPGQKIEEIQKKKQEHIDKANKLIGGLGKSFTEIDPNTFYMAGTRQAEIAFDLVYELSLAGYHKFREVVEHVKTIAGKYMEIKGFRDAIQDAYDANQMDEEAMEKRTETIDEILNVTDAPARPERRVDTGKRKTIDEMNDEEKTQALTYDELTGMKSKRAWEDLKKLPVQVLIDADGLKWINDNLGYAQGNELLQAIGQALRSAGIEAYRIGGDEIRFQDTSTIMVEKAMEKVYNILKDRIITATAPDGTVTQIKGLGVSYGYAEAISDSPEHIESAEKLSEDKLHTHKVERERLKLRSPRGEEPPGLSRTSPTGIKDQGNIEPAQTDLFAPPSKEAQNDQATTNAPGSMDGSSTGLRSGTTTKGNAQSEVGRSGNTDIRGNESNVEGRKQPAPERADGSDSTKLLSTETGGAGNSRGDEPVVTPNLPAGEKPKQQLIDYLITEADQIGIGGAAKKTADNIAVIRLLKQLEKEDRWATADEQKVLVKYVGWGGLSNVFKQTDKNYQVLKDLLTPQEYAKARASTRNAHYTSPLVVKSVWKALSHFGFNGGNVLEPAIGIGHFFGLRPSGVKISMEGIEMDITTATIAKHLYQNAVITNSPYQNIKMPKDQYQVIISNVPFDKYSPVEPNDVKTPGLTGSPSLHNFYFLKSLYGLKPGGILAFVTSHYTMDAPTNRDVRKQMIDQADFIGAIRLPKTAFKDNAGTEVITDIIFMQKREPGQEDHVHYPLNQTFIETGTLTMDKEKEPGTKDVQVAKYFIDRPSDIMGKQDLKGSMYGPDQYNVSLDPSVTPEQFAKMIDDQISTQWPGNIISDYVEKKTEELKKDTFADWDNVASMPRGSYFIEKGELYQIDNGTGKPKKYDGAKSAEPRVRAQVKIKNATRKMFHAQRVGDAAEAKKYLGEMNKAYDEFVKKFGYLNDVKNVRAFIEDNDAYLLQSLENYDTKTKTGKKTDIFSGIAFAQEHALEKTDAPIDAMIVSLNTFGSVNIPHISKMLGVTADEATQRLIDDSLIYKNPSDFLKGNTVYVTREEYLSGNVREKHAIAKKAAAKDKLFNNNVRDLDKIIPADKPAERIIININSPLLLEKDVEDFAKSVYGGHSHVAIHNKTNGNWDVGFTAYGPAMDRDYGTGRINGEKLLNLMLNGKQPKVFDTFKDDSGKKTTVFNQEETTLAETKAEAVNKRFKEWIWTDAERKERLVRAFNDRFNSIVNSDFVHPMRLQNPDAPVTFPGSAFPYPARKHQSDAVWRVIQSKRTMLAHEVGAGKTMEMIWSGMELKRMGLINKPVYVFPNHMVNQWAGDFYKAYPNAKILVAREKDFKPENRKVFINKIATGNWDAVLIKREDFLKIPLSPKEQIDQLQRMIDDFTAFAESLAKDKATAGGRKPPTVKDIEEKIKNFEQKIQDLQNKSKKEKGILNFEDLGIDMLFLDEADEYKNLTFYTSLQGVKGLGSQKGSGRALDMFMKTTYMHRKGQRMVFATGTPISNTMVEAYSMMRYLQPEWLEENGIGNFDDWQRMFAQTVVNMELNNSGTSYVPTTRFSKIVNLPELMQSIREVWDIKNAAYLEEHKILTPGKDLPHHKVINVSAPLTDLIKSFKRYLVRREKGLKGQKPEKGADNVLAMITDGVKASVDLRLFHPSLPNDPNSKLNIAADNIVKVYKKYEKQKYTQIVFFDRPLANRKDHATDKPVVVFDAAEALIERLVAGGIKREEIAQANDKKYEKNKAKAELFADVREGRIRVLIGSVGKMGAGTNVQDRVKAIHHIEAKWRPRDFEQANGRGVRQRNTVVDWDENGNRTTPEGEIGTVEIYNYTTKGSLDPGLWAMLESKAKVIKAIMNNKGMSDEVEEDYFSSIKELSIDDPVLKEAMTLRHRAKELTNLEKAHIDTIARLKLDIASLPGQIKSLKADIAKSEKDIEQRAAEKPIGDNFKITVKGKEYTDREQAYKELQKAFDAIIEKHKKEKKPQKDVEIGKYAGFPIYANSMETTINVSENPELYKPGLGYTIELVAKGSYHYYATLDKETKSIPGLLTSLNRTLYTNMENRIERLKEQIKENEKSMLEAHKRIDDKFEHGTELAAAKARIAELDKVLSAVKDEPIKPSDEPVNWESLKNDLNIGASDQAEEEEGIREGDEEPPAEENTDEEPPEAPAMLRGRATGSMTLDALNEKVQGELPRVMRMLPKDFKGKVNVSISKEFIYKGRKFGGDDWEAAVWYDPKGKVVEVHINPNISEKRLAMALMHELPGHIGSRLVYADNMPVYNRMKAFFDKMNAENHPSVTKIKDLYEAELRNDVDNEKLFDEWTAAQLSEYIENGKRNSITTRIYNFFRELLTKLGVVSKNLNDTMREMINLMRKGTYETLGGNKPFQRFLYDTSGQRVEDTLTQEEKEENIRRARATASDYSKKPRTLTKKARKELKEAGYYVPETDQEPVIFYFNNNADQPSFSKQLKTTADSLEKLIADKYEGNAPQEEIDALEAEYEKVLAAEEEALVSEEGQGDKAASEGISLEEELSKLYANYIKKEVPATWSDREGVVGTMRAAIIERGGRQDITDEEVLAAAKDAYETRKSFINKYRSRMNLPAFSKVPKTVAEENAIRQAELDRMRGYSVYDRSGKVKKITEQDLPGIYEEAKTFNPDKARKAISKKYEVKQTGVNLAKYLGRTLSGRFLEISPIVRDKLQKHINKIHIDTANSMRRVLPLLEAVKKLPEADYRVFDIASKNSDVAEMDSIAEKYGFLAALEGYREVMNDMIVRAKAAGYETGYLENYFPRIPRDRNQYYKFIRKTPEWGQIDEALKQKAIDVGRQLEPVEEDEFINQYLRGYAGKNILGKPGNLKERKMKFIDNEMNSLLEDTILAIPMYLERMNKKIARKELFGNANTSDDMIVDNIDESIGKYVGNLIRDYKLNPEKQDELIGLLKSYFNFKPTDRGLAVIKNLSYATSMGSGFSSMFSQMQDMTFSFVTAPGNTAGAVLKALQGKTDITVKDLGIQDLGAEFRDPGKLFAAVDKLLTVVGLKWGDVTFKNAFIQANLKKFQTMARTGKYSSQFKNDIVNIFDEKADELVSDLKNGRNSDLVKLLVMNEMSKYQPITQFQVPQGYLDMPRGRIAYALKTYQINQVNAIIDEGIRAMQNAKDGDEWKAALLRVLGIMAVLMIAGMGMDSLKDLLFRRKATMSEYAWDNLLKLFAISRYTTWQARTKGLYPTLLSLVAPPLNWIEYAWRDIGTATKNPEDFKLKNLESLRMLPIIGQEYHWWFGGGAEQTRKRAEKNLPPVKFEREIRKLKSEARRAARRGDDFEAAKKEQQIKELAEKSKPIIEEYFKKETEKAYPKKFQMMLEFENSKVQKLRYKSEEMFKSLNIGEKALYSKFKNESREKR